LCLKNATGSREHKMSLLHPALHMRGMHIHFTIPASI
jgi:hypothetical protein